MNRFPLAKDFEVFCLSKAEAALLYEDVFVENGYFRHGIHLGASPVVFDVGANIGLFSLYVHRHCRNSKLFCFEPLPPIFGVLEANIALHGVDARLFACGLSAVRGVATFTFYPHNSALSGQYADRSEDEGLARNILKHRDPEIERDLDILLEGKFASERFMRPLATLSEIMEQHKVDRVDLLKIDVEKAEADVLDGIAPHDWSRIRQVVLEAHDRQGKLSHIVALLQKHGFKTVVEQNPNFRGTCVYDVFATR